MGTPYIGEIRLLPYNYAPVGWLTCDGSLQSISENEALYVLLGTTYGGDGQTTFGLPDLRGRVPIHNGNGTGLSSRPPGQQGGTEAETLTTPQMGAHSHALQASTAAATATTPGSTVVLAAVPTSQNDSFYATNPSNAAFFPATTLQPTGSSQPHDNTAPTLSLQYCIAANGVFPQQS